MTYMVDRVCQMNFKLTRDERMALQNIATAMGLSMSDTIRQLIRERWDELKTEAA